MKNFFKEFIIFLLILTFGFSWWLLASPATTIIGEDVTVGNNLYVPGRVGIGTMQPAAQLHVIASDTSTVPFQVEVSTLIGNFRKPITIDNTSNANALTDYQVLVTLDTASLISAGKMRSDCGDIRFTDSDGQTLLNYWLESGCNTASTKIWVKVPLIPASATKTIYVYYGNPNATSQSNVTNTFIREIDGVIGSWNFNEGSGIVASDSSGNGNNGTLYSGSTVCSNPPTAGCPTWVDGKFGKALRFDGVDDYVNIGDINSVDGASKLTVEVWVKLNELNREQIFTGKVDVYWLEIGSDNRIGFDIYNGVTWGTPAFSSQTYTTGVWHHVVGVYDSSLSSNQLKVYVDGVLVGTGSNSGNLNSNAYPVQISGWSGSPRYYRFNGTIDEVRIYNRALSDAEIQDLYNYYGYTTTNYPGRVLVRKYTSPEPTTSVGTEEPAPLSEQMGLYIQPQTGNVSIGTTTADYKLRVEGTAAAYNWVTLSDISLKENIQPLNFGALNKVLKLRPVSFYWKDKNIDKEKHFGFVAQEVEKVLPELVREDSEGKKHLNYDEFIPLLVAAIKEQQRQIEQLKLEINEKGSLSQNGKEIVNSEFSTSSIELIKQIFKEGILQIEKLFVKEIEIERSKIKEAEIQKARINKMEMVDQNDGQIYCIWVENGEIKKVKGECDTKK